MKKILFTIALLFVAINVHAHDFSAVCPSGQTLYYSITDTINHKVAVVAPSYSHISELNTYRSVTSGHIVIPETVPFNNSTYIVDRIAGSAFSLCINITGVTFPSSIRRVDGNAFDGCSSLTGRITLPKATIAAQAFINCTSLKVAEVGNIYASDVFSNCVLDSLIIDDSATVLTISRNLIVQKYLYVGKSISTISGDYNAVNPNTLHFNAKNCTQMRARTQYMLRNTGDYMYVGIIGFNTLILGEDVKSIPENAFSMRWLESGPSYMRTIVYKPTHIENINASAFQCFERIIYNNTSYFTPAEGKNNFNKVVIGNNVEYIPEHMFDGWGMLQGSVIIPNSLDTINNYLFANTLIDTVLMGDPILSVGEGAFKNCTSLDNIVFSNSISEIKNQAFYGCSGLTGTLILPDSVMTIGNSAFKNCNNITSLQFSSQLAIIGDSAFEGCSGLTGQLSLPNSLITIGNAAFRSCGGLSSIHFSPTLNQIGSSAFEDCSGITGLITIPYSVSSIGESAFRNCSNLSSVILPQSITQIPDSVFCGDVNLSGHFIIPDSVEIIGEKAFCRTSIDTITVGLNAKTMSPTSVYGCNNISTVIFKATNMLDVENESLSPLFFVREKIQKVMLGDNVKNIPSYLFSGCQHLKEIIIPNSVEHIGNSTFLNCDSLITLTLGNSVRYIGDKAFQNCQNITGVLSMPRSLNHIGVQAFSNCDNIIGININNAAVLVSDSAFQNCDRLVMVDLGNSATSIGENAFQGCFRLNSFNMGNSVTSIGNNAFNGCVRLPFPTLSPSLVSIGTSAFQGCSMVQGNLTFPSNISTIGNNAFAQCGNITSLTMKSATPPTIFANTFSGISTSIPVYVPCGCVLNYYVTNYWENFSNILEAQPYEITTSVNENLMGVAQVTTVPTCANHSAVITASANSGFHFVRWSDGNSINPRLVYLTQDTSFTAIFAVNNIYITVHSSDSVKGTVEGSGVYSYNGLAVLSATANATYHFLRWNDGNTDNPRYVFATQDSSFTAIFVSNASYITVGNYNPEMGTVSGGGLYYYMQQISIMAIPNYGYHFFQWNDGNMQNPRPIIVNCDTSFMAYFAPNIYSIAVNSNNTTMGTVTGSGNYNYNMFISITATANYGYHFTQWNDGNTNNPRSLTVTCDSAFTAQFAANTYQITVTPNDPLMGGAYGSGTYTYNSQTTISASPTYGYHFVQWNDGSTENPRTISVTHNAQYEAQFAVNFYTINVASNNPAIGTASGGGNYSYNSIINLVATPNYGYHFTQWSDGNTDNPRTVTVMQNATYTAQFAINTYSVSVGQNNASMGVVSGSGNYIYNTLATISATPYYGYHFTQWNDGNTENPRTVLVSQNMTFTAQFDVNTYNLSVISNNITAGYTTGSGTYNYNDIVAITAIPAPHYHFVAWSDSVMENPRNVIITKDTLYTALFTIDAHTVSATPNNSVMGSVQGAGSYDYGTNVALRAIPNYGYHFVQWNDGVTQNPRHFTLFTDTSFVAQFGVNTYTATILSGDTLMGSVSNSGTYNYLTQLTLTATPVFGYHFDHWSDGSTDNPRTLTLTRDTVIMAYFAINMYQVDLAVNDSTLGNVSGAGTYPYLTQVIVSASANEHCHFVQWSDGSTSNPRQFSITGDVSLTAEFAEDDKFTIQVFSSDENMGYVSVGGEYYVGTQISISAFPYEHYQFLHWSDGVTDNPRTVTVLENAVFTAVFAPMMYDITVLSSNEAMGNVYGSGSYAYGTTIEISATPNEGYHFECWSDGDSNITRTILVESNASYTAEFAEGVSVEDWVIRDIQVYPNPTKDMVFVLSDEVIDHIEIINLAGQVVRSVSQQDWVSLHLLPSGTYIIQLKIGDTIVNKKIVKQ